MSGVKTWAERLAESPDDPEVATACATHYLETVTDEDACKAVMHRVGKPLWAVLRKHAFTHPNLVVACGRLFYRLADAPSNQATLFVMRSTFLDAMKTHANDPEVACVVADIFGGILVVEEAAPVLPEVPVFLAALARHIGCVEFIVRCVARFVVMAKLPQYAAALVVAGVVPALATALEAHPGNLRVAEECFQFFTRVRAHHAEVPGVVPDLALTLPAVMVVLNWTSERHDADSSYIAHMAVKWCKRLAVAHNRLRKHLVPCVPLVLQTYKTHPSVARGCFTFLGHVAIHAVCVHDVAKVLPALVVAMDAHKDDFEVVKRVMLCGGNVAFAEEYRLEVLKALAAPALVALRGKPLDLKFALMIFGALQNMSGCKGAGPLLFELGYLADAHRAMDAFLVGHDAKRRGNKVELVLSIAGTCLNMLRGLEKDSESFNATMEVVRPVVMLSGQTPAQLADLCADFKTMYDMSLF